MYTCFYSKYLNQFYIVFNLHSTILHDILTFHFNNDVYISISIEFNNNIIVNNINIIITNIIIINYYNTVFK